MQPIYNFWQMMEIVNGKMNAPGYLEFMKSNNKMILLAYQNARFLGVNVPHVDPQKEVKAELLKLGGSKLPISTHKQVSENLGDGEWDANVSTYKQELNDNQELIDSPDDDNNTESD